MTAPAAPALVVARVGTERYGFDLAAVREVVAIQDVAQVPSLSAAVRGVMPRGSRHVTLVSLAALLSGGAPPPVAGGAAVVVTAGGAELALEVDEVESVVNGGAEFVAAASAGGLPARGVWRCGTALVTVLDTETLAGRVTAREERER
jgi:chemotaxis signal transduction protein